MEGGGRKEAGGWPERRVEDDANGIDCWRRCNGTGTGIGPWRASNTSGRRGGKKRNERDLKELRRDKRTRRKRTSQAAGGTLISGYVTLSPSLSLSLPPGSSPLSRQFGPISGLPSSSSNMYTVQNCPAQQPWEMVRDRDANSVQSVWLSKMGPGAGGAGRDATGCPSSGRDVGRPRPSRPPTRPISPNILSRTRSRPRRG